ncbi:MAG: bifunctional phosphoribosylaminoimidazolecarboxamide formyltransferase/inosine monophosphate cyclohydrolase [Spirochaetaceae bacterium]|jgi:phosphoribosylaminoimidazolecarboxamide formyltransferase/IMP cyclohydrolase|nr:bifunctional phosphoribosylaminoimidazolecarboxamide formyltransferase/inosine monophosphate cyclohydrolase [Spirochaetaceae bacterium]
MKRRALISVYDKSGIIDLALFLFQAGWEILSTGGTARYLGDHHIPVTDVSAVTGFPECLDGRVKTLHPAIHAGLLARRNLPSHMETLEKLGLGTIDLVCVNLYPFFEKVQGGLSLEETVEFIDIGGPTMIRSAAKNYRDVIVLTDPADYGELIGVLKSTGTLEPSAGLRKRLAGKVFDLTSAYDGAIARYLLELDGPSLEDSAPGARPGGVTIHPPDSARPGDSTAGGAAGGRVEADTADSPGTAERYPPFWPLALRRAQTLRYGENGHQSGALYLSAGKAGALGGMEQLHGKELGYNNIRDLDLAWKAACAFGLGDQPALGEGDVLRLGLAEAGGRCGGPCGSSNGPPAEGGGGGPRRGRSQGGDFPPQACCVAVKHNTPCGIALGGTLLEAYEKVYACDPVSIFGGIVASTVKVDAAAALKLGNLFLEIIAAPDYDGDALEILKKKKNLRVMRARRGPSDRTECTAVDGGLLVQETDRRLLESWDVVTRAEPKPEDLPDMIFGMRAVSFVKSNAIVVVRDRAAMGIGGGQTNRIWAAEQALARAGAAGPASGGVFTGPARVLASDAFFPFSDVVDAAAAAGIRAIVQPGGSIRDGESIEACDKHGIAMVFTGTRHFKH